MSSENIALDIEKELGFVPTAGQQRAIVLLSHFVTTPKPHAACILRGYAGTGKTSIVSALVRVMRKWQKTVVLLAPTGRAAKVFARMRRRRRLHHSPHDLPAGNIPRRRNPL